MKSYIKNWAATNLLELSTWIGMVMFVREFFSYNPSTLMLILALVLIFASDAKINGFIQAKTPGLKSWIDKL